MAFPMSMVVLSAAIPSGINWKSYKEIKIQTKAPHTLTEVTNLNIKLFHILYWHTYSFQVENSTLETWKKSTTILCVIIDGCS